MLDFDNSDLVVIYLHGFLSSPASIKAQQALNFCQQHGIEIHIPELPFEPLLAMQQLEQQVSELEQQAAQQDRHLLLIGSSLGGYYATYLANRFAIPAALINPAVQPHLLFENYLGEHEHYYNGQTYTLTLQHVEQIKRFYYEPASIRQPETLLLLLQTGDETLDYRLAASYYQNSPQICQAGGDHSYQDFVERLPLIIQWRRQLIA